jgi:SAM-dependent methyltransferase
MALGYDWDSYDALEQGETLFARRNHEFQKANADAAGFLEGQEIKALEFGIGTGGSAKYFLARFPQMHLTGIDIDPAVLKIAQLTLAPQLGQGGPASYEGRLDLQQKSLESFNSPSIFDLVYGVFVTHNFEDDKKRDMMEKGLSLLKPGGILLLGDVMTYSDSRANKDMWRRDYKMIEELDSADYEFWKNHFDQFDSKFSSPVAWHLRTLEQLASSAEATYRDGFWTVIRAHK